MSYFADHYLDARYPIDFPDDPGLRTAQLGALHAIGSHFTLRSDPAIVVMPTGSGKTAVLMLSAFQQRAGRVLVITPSRLMRKQIYEEFRDLQVLTRLDALPRDIALPSIEIVTERPKDQAAWEMLRMFDIVVTTPNCLSPSYDDVAKPPSDLFDFVLVDEAHHSAAVSWNELIFSFENAKRILFTATPFRRDLKQIPGRLVYTYPLKKAYQEGIFGKITYERVEENGESADVAVARAAEAVFRRDRALGLNHLLMVRTDFKTRAKDLKEIYDTNTTLKLEVVSSDFSEKRVTETLTKLQERSIDGIICVDMLGEGFDFPHLKIAAIHAPHKSLAVTLQFIGRFARTNAQDIGGATFLAVEQDIQGEMSRMFYEGALWDEMVIDLSQKRIDEETNVREVIEQFETPASASENLDAEISLHTLRPFNHVKIYKVNGTVDIGADLDFGKDCEIVLDKYNPERNARVFITCQSEHPKWSTSEDFDRPDYDLFIIYYHQTTGLLFINATEKAVEMYEEVASQFTAGSFRILPVSQVNKVLLDLEEPKFFNIGMRNVHQGDNTESYRTLTGPSVQNAVQESDGMLYHRGHVFGSAAEGEVDTTVGYSSSSKIWRNGRTPIPILLQWCEQIAQKLASSREVKTGSNLDRLDVGEIVSSIPEAIIGVQWAGREFKKPPAIRYINSEGDIIEGSVLDLDLQVDRAATNTEQIIFQVLQNEKAWQFKFSMDSEKMFTRIPDENNTVLNIEFGRRFVALEDYFNSHPLHFFTADCSRLCGQELFPFRPSERVNFDRSKAISIDWLGQNVCIETEYGAGKEGRLSIHDFLKTYLNVEGNDVVFYDHRSGEIADFVCLSLREDTVWITLYHCKGSGGAAASERVGDVYEVIGQVIKSLIWIHDNRRLKRQMLNRFREGAKFIKGNKDLLDEIFDEARNRMPVFEIVAVQPGISKAQITNKTDRVYGAANDFIISARCEALKILCSQ